MTGRPVSENRAAASEAARSILPQAPLPPMGIGNKRIPRILIADEIAVFRSLIRMTLQNCGPSRVDEASNGNHALSSLADAHYDLLICDLFMPSLDGLSLLQALRADDSLKDLPVVIVTGESTLESVVEAMTLGISGYVCKPFKPSALLDAVYYALSERVTDDIH